MPPKGYKLSAESKAKISAARTVPRIDRVCPVCGKSFTAHICEVRRGRGIYCSQSCSKKEQFKIYNPVRGAKISAALKGRVFTDEWKAKISAANQGKVSVRKGAHHTDEAKQKLHDARIGQKHTPETIAIFKATRKGENNPAWRGGVSFEPYCPKFNKDLKERVRAFFGYKCLGCGVEQNGEKLSVHHIHYNKNACCDETPAMFAPLCRSCHGKTNKERNENVQKFAEIIKTKYNGKSYFSREEFENLKIV
jgi:hypothetical protein